MKSRFKPDIDSAPGPTPALVDPEAFDVSEQRFAASLEEKPGEHRPRFVPDHAEGRGELSEDDQEPPMPPQNRGADNQLSSTELGAETARAATPESGLEPTPGPDSWRREVAARVNRYRGKRPRAPRYPSLQLNFEPGEPTAMVRSSNAVAAASRGQLAITMDVEPAPEGESQTAEAVDDVQTDPPERATKILAFPRSSSMPQIVVDELAEPVFDQPRILEVPEVLPPPPALGGISIESTEKPADERRPGFELPLKSAPLTRRVLAGMTDGLIVGAAFTAFSYLFFRITAAIPALREGLSVGAGLLMAFWAAYQYLFLVHSGSTPGLRLAKLELSRFDGRSVPRKLRRWRVLASVLSALSLALGYVWCFMDEDELCWHDRITHTYMAPKVGKTKPAPADHN
jgi:uncharacterized RDD family membrane protein YckC